MNAALTACEMCCEGVSRSLYVLGVQRIRGRRTGTERPMHARRPDRTCRRRRASYPRV